MKLFHSQTSPYVRKVMITLHETGRLGEVDLIPTATTPVATDSELAAINPLGKVPCLVLDDGRAIFDSRVICAFLGEPAGLYPASRVWEIRTMEAMADGIVDAAILCVYEARLRSEAQRSAAWVEGQMAKVARSLNAAEQEFFGALDGGITMAQIAMGAALGYLDLRFPDIGWREDCHALAGWFDAFSHRPSMQATMPPK